MGREGAVSAPQAKAWPPRTIFLAPALRLSSGRQGRNVQGGLVRVPRFSDDELVGASL